MKKAYRNYVSIVSGMKSLPLLFFRLILAYGFYEPAMMKLKGLQGTADWFGSMDYPLPFVAALLAAVTEGLGVVMLALGLGTRIIVLPLMFVMVVAIFTVHLGNGFPAGDNGIEIPLYYLIMLFGLMVFGPGKISVDHLVFRRK